MEQGFTLLELLVAMTILSILVALGTQYYLHHRRKAWDAQTRSSVRNMAAAENHFVFAEGRSSFTKDLDDLFFAGYRWSEKSLLPYVALATNQTFCIQVHSAYDPTIVWHFSSDVGQPEPGPATPQACGDPNVLGRYIAGLPPAGAGRDGQLSSGSDGSTTTASGPGGTSSGRDGDSSVEEGEFGTGGSSNGGGSGDERFSDVDGDGFYDADGDGYDDDPVPTTTGTGSTGASGTDGTGTTGSTSGGTPTTDGCGTGSTGSGSTTGTNHPSGKDRDAENGNTGGSASDPDGDENDGEDKPGQGGGANTGDQDGNNGSGNDTDFEDDNRGPDRDGTPTSGTGCGG